MNLRRSRLTRSESQAQTRQRLRLAARHEFATRGIAAASIDRISENAGFSRGAFYANYADKHELLLELLTQHQAAEIATWQTLLDAEGPLASVLPTLRDRFDAFAANADEVLFAAELHIEALRNPAFALRYRDYAREIGARTRTLAATFIARAGGGAVSAEVLGKALQSFSPQLIAEARMGLGEPGVTPGERLVTMIIELLAARPQAPEGRHGVERTIGYDD